jgi:hypothetical protein
VDGFLRLENGHTGEILRMREYVDASGQIFLNIDGSLPTANERPADSRAFPSARRRGRESGLARCPSRK